MSENTITAKKSLGQHFLIDKQVILDIIQCSGIEKDEKVLEIGPGTGVLTKALLNAGAKVYAFEKDDRAIAVLQKEFKNELENGTFTLFHDDYLHTNAENLEQIGLVSGGFKIIANIPYYITGKIVSHALESKLQPKTMVLMVQKEVAERIVAEDGKESILSLSVKLFGLPKIIRHVSKHSFRPPPDVESSVISISGINNDFFDTNKLKYSEVFAFIKAGFAHKRKILIKNLITGGKIGEKDLKIEKLNEIWAKFGFDQNLRAEEIGVETWKKLILELLS